MRWRHRVLSVGCVVFVLLRRSIEFSESVRFGVDLWMR